MRDRESVRGRWKTSSPVRHRTGYSPRTKVRWEAATRCILRCPFREAKGARDGARSAAERGMHGCNPGLSTGGSGRCLEHWKGLKARDQKQDVCRPTTDGAATRKRRAAGKRKRKKDVSPKRTGLTARLPFGGPISPEGQSEAIAAGRGPSEAPGKTKNRDVGNPEISEKQEKAERPN